MAIDKIDKIVSNANENKRSQDNIVKLLELSNKLEGGELTVSKDAIFVTEGDFKEIDAKGKSDKRRFYLFEDKMVVVKPKGSKYLFISELPIEKLVIWDVKDDDPCIRIPF